MENKINEKDIRLKYTRGLEKFVRSNISYLKDPTFEFEIFQKRVKRTFEILKKIKHIRLNATYPIALENYVNLILGILHVEELKDGEKDELQAKLLKGQIFYIKKKTELSTKKTNTKKVVLVMVTKK